MNNKKTIKIGVLGGIGPEATSEFYHKLIFKLQDTGVIKSNLDFPQIIINSIPAPELVHETISEADLQPYIKGLKELDSMNVDFIVMVCNTIHLFYDRLQKEINTPIIDLRNELENTIKQRKIKSTLILGTPTIVKNGLYQFKGINSIEPDEMELKELTNAILNFNLGKNKQKQVQKVRMVCQKYVKKDSITIILGCTELALMLSNEGIQKINTLDVLVEATVKRFLAYTKK